MKRKDFEISLVAWLALSLLMAGLAQAQTETVLYNFCSQPNCSDGDFPAAALISDSAGNFYGTTGSGGLIDERGTVFELSPDGNGGWTETVLYAFTGGVDGGNPDGPVLFDNAGNLYGTTTYGGDLTCSGGLDGCGVVFELSPVEGSWTETVLYSFHGGTDGIYPAGTLIMDPVGNLYGTTQGGGAYGGGTVFELSPSGGGWTEQVIYSAGHTYWGMTAWLTMDAARNIFGGSSSTVFELSPNGKGGWNPTVIRTFSGSIPRGALVLDKAGNLYGVTMSYAAKKYGMVYKLIHGKRGSWTERALYSFKGGKSGANPYAGIVFDPAGNMYGTTSNGAVYELMAPVGKGKYQEKILWNFHGPDGAYPVDSLILDNAGNLYGTTMEGGSPLNGCSGQGCGVVFEVIP